MTIKTKKFKVTNGKTTFPLTNLRGDYSCTIKYNGDAHYKGTSTTIYLSVPATITNPDL